MGLRDLFNRKKKKGLPSKIYIGSLIEMRDFIGLPVTYPSLIHQLDEHRKGVSNVKGGLFTVESGFMGGFVIQRYSPKKAGMINHSGIVNHLHSPDAKDIGDCNLEERYVLSGYSTSAEWVGSFVGIVKDVSKGILPKGTLFKVNPDYIHWWRGIRYGVHPTFQDVLMRNTLNVAHNLLSNEMWSNPSATLATLDAPYSHYFEQTDAWNHFVNLYWGATSDTMTWNDFKSNAPKTVEGQQVTMMFRHGWELSPATLPEGGMWNPKHQYGKVFPSFFTYDTKRHNKIFKKFFPKIQPPNTSNLNHNAYEHTWVVGSSCQIWGGNDKSIGLIPYISLKKIKGQGYEIHLQGGPKSMPSSSEQIILPLKKNRKPYIKDKTAVISALTPYGLGWLVKMNIFEVVGYDLSVAENALKGNRYYDPDMARTSADANPTQASDENINLAYQVREHNFEGLYAPIRPHDIVDYKDLPVLKVVKLKP